MDHGNTAVLETVDDVHVLTGALKLFFRELKEPLIPWECVDRLIAVCNLPSKKAKIKGIVHSSCLGLHQGWKKPGFLKKNSPVGFFGFFFCFFFGFFGFFIYIFAQKREFLGFFSFKNTFMCIQL